mmetsp:Transcript_46788/g.142002  ORF Transcript_46788/g.142002 Transcript_46788/m.142002 type:complete len:263 (+) Transcript_46788:979-1767(+)
MPRFAFVVQTSSFCAFPALTTKTRDSPNPFEATSATFMMAAHVFPKPLPSLQPLPSFARFTRVTPLSTPAASSTKAFAAPPETSSCAEATWPPGTTASAGKARTYNNAPVLPLELSNRIRLSLRELSMPAILRSKASNTPSSVSANANSPFNTGTCFTSMGMYWPVLPKPDISSRTRSTGGAWPCALICLWSCLMICLRFRSIISRHLRKAVVACVTSCLLKKVAACFANTKWAICGLLSMASSLGMFSSEMPLSRRFLASG